MEAGKLDRRVTIQRKTVAPDAFNEPVETWGDLITVWASKEDVRDSERFSAQEVGAEITTRFQVRWCSAIADLDTMERVIFDGRVYAIAGVKELGRREGLEITASARAERA